MMWQELRGTLQDRQVQLEASGGSLRVSGSREALTPEVQRAIRAHSKALMMHLTGRLVACKDLYRYVKRGDRVGTPDGEGTVLQVFADRVTVLCDGADRASFFRPEDVSTPDRWYKWQTDPGNMSDPETLEPPRSSREVKGAAPSIRRGSEPCLELEAVTGQWHCEL